MNFVLKIESMIVKTILCLTELLGSIDLIGTSARNTLKTYHVARKFLEQIDQASTIFVNWTRHFKILVPWKLNWITNSRAYNLI